MVTQDVEVRVVVDTNAVVSAVLFPGGRLSWVRHLWTEGRILPLVSTAKVRELIRVLAYPKFHLDEIDIEAVLSAYLPFTESVDVPPDARRGLPRCRDPHDQMLLDLAAAGGAEVLVSGDRALLEMVTVVPFTIEAPARFRKRLV
jgi:putative PIN family toxin of toxin-antitoxin system